MRARAAWASSGMMWPLSMMSPLSGPVSPRQHPRSHPRRPQPLTAGGVDAYGAGMAGIDPSTLEPLEPACAWRAGDLGDAHAQRQPDGERAAVGAGQGPVGQVAVFDCRNFDMDVDPVHERPGDAGAITMNVTGGAGAGVGRVAEIAAGTGVEGRDKHDPCRVGHR